MDERRQHPRHTNLHQLEAFDASSNVRLGRVADLSETGFMLFSEQQIAVDSLWQIRLCLATPLNGIQELQLGADCLWSRPGADGSHAWAGFQIIDLSEAQEQLLREWLKHL